MSYRFNSSSGKDNIYLNMSIPNIIVESRPMPHNLQAVIDTELTVPVLDKPSDYYASIIRFQLPVDNIPIFSFPLNPNQSNPNVSALVIGIQTAAGANYNQTVVYVPGNNLSVPVTSAVTAPYFTYMQVTNPYYFVYSIQQFINMVNTALLNAVIASGIGVTAPYYIFTPTTSLISLIISSAFIASGAQIYMNDFLRIYFSSFNFTTIDDPLSGAYLYFHDLSILPYGSPSGGPYQFEEEYDTMCLWADIRNIIITTTSIPISQEATPTYSSARLGLNGSANYSAIFTDYAFTFTSFNDFKAVATYVPTSQYRLADLNSQSPLTRINLNFYWLSKNGSLYPIYISPNQVVSVKIGFFKKELYNSSIAFEKNM